MNRLRFGLVGVGAMGRHHLRTLRRCSEVEVVAVADPAPPVDLAVPAYATSEELLARHALDAVVVASPTETHFALGRLFLEAGVPTLIEKPLAASVGEARALVALARKGSTPLLVGHVERYNAVVEAVKRAVEAGMAGQVASISTRRVGLAPPLRRDKRNNVVIDMAVHDLDIITWLYGRRPQGLIARVGQALGPTPDYAEILMDFGSGSASVQVNWLTPVRIRTLALTGTEAFLQADYMEQTLRVFRHAARTAATYEELRSLQAKGEVREIPVERQEPLARQLQGFLGVLRGEERPRADGEVGLAAVELAEIALASQKQPLPLLATLPPAQRP
jgi:UDP-N-acetylglucosamine 3-dehydrogenase